MNTIYVVVRYRDVQGPQAFLLSRAFQNREDAMRFISAMNVQTGNTPQYQSTPPDAIYDASVIGTHIRVALIPTQLDVGIPSIIRPLPVTSQTTGVSSISRQIRNPLTIQRVDDNWHISGGNTFTYRSQLKNLNGRWNPVSKIWVIPVPNTTEEALRQLLGQ